MDFELAITPTVRVNVVESAKDGIGSKSLTKETL